MEEADRITLQHLRAVGCDLENTSSIAQMGADHVVEAVGRCLAMISGSGENFVRKLPANLAERWRLAHSLVDAIQNLGYRGDLSYNLILYPNERDLRSLLMFLVDALPKDASDVKEDITSSSLLLQRFIAEKVRQQIVSPWLPAYCKRHGQIVRGGVSTLESTRDIHQFRSQELSIPHTLNTSQRSEVDVGVLRQHFRGMSFVTRQIRTGCSLNASLLEWSARLLLREQRAEARAADILEEDNSQLLENALTNFKKSRELAQTVLRARSDSKPAPPPKPGVRATVMAVASGDQDTAASSSQSVASSETEEERIARQEAEMADVRVELDAVDRELTELRVGQEQLEAAEEAAGADIAALNEEMAAREKELIRMRRTAELLPEAVANINKLTALSAELERRLEAAAQKWDDHRVPLEQALKEARAAAEARYSRLADKLELLKEARESSTQLKSELRQRQDEVSRLTAAAERAAAARSDKEERWNRRMYTASIYDFIGNIKKQKAEIDRVLEDTRLVQKEINLLSGKQARTYAVTDELVFANAKRDEPTRRAYKLLAALHECCSSLVRAEEERGVIQRETRELDDLLAQEQRKNVQENKEKMGRDLEEMRATNKKMKQEAKKLLRSQ